MAWLVGNQFDLKIVLQAWGLPQWIPKFSWGYIPWGLCENTRSPYDPEFIFSSWAGKSTGVGLQWTDQGSRILVLLRHWKSSPKHCFWKMTYRIQRIKVIYVGLTLNFVRLCFVLGCRKHSLLPFSWHGDVQCHLTYRNNQREENAAWFIFFHLSSYKESFQVLLWSIE